MARPREFDRALALDRAMTAFWANGFCATSTEDLLGAMGIGRQSFYNAFGDKRRLYLEALAAYQQRSNAAHLARLNAPASPAQGVFNLLRDVVASDARERAMGCMGVNAVSEFGADDPEIADLRTKAGAALGARITMRIREGQAAGEFDPNMSAGEAAAFVQMTMTGIQLAARAGAAAADLRKMARFAADRLKAT